MNCKQAKGKLALLIGNDLDGSSMQDVQQHLGACSGCREHLKQLSSCLEVLQVPAGAAFDAAGESLWPRLSVRLASPSAGQKAHRLSGWAPTLAVAAACTAMFWVASRQFVNEPGISTFSAPGSQVPYQPVDEPVGPRLYNPQDRSDDTEGDSTRPPQRKSGIIRLRDSDSSSVPLVPVNESR